VRSAGAHTLTHARQTAEIISLLYGATQGPELPFQPPAMNPTAGTTINQPIESLQYKRDPTRPGGGVFVARGVVTTESPDADVELKLDELELPRAVSASAPNTPGTQGSAKTPPPSAPAPVPAEKPAKVPPSRARGKSRSTAPPSRQSSARQASLPALAPAPPHPPPAGQHPLAHPAAAAAASHPAVGPQPMVQDFGEVPFGAFGNGNLNPALAAGGAGFAQVQLMNALDAPTDGDLAQLALADTGFLEGMPTTMFDWGQWDSFFARLPPAGDAAFMFAPPPSDPTHGDPMGGMGGPYPM
jgi:hypothetical protein